MISPAPVTPKVVYDPFTTLELSHIQECAEERGQSVTALIRAAVLDDLYR